MKTGSTHLGTFQDKNRRILWVDYCKGIGIFFVVLGHTLRGLSDSIGLNSDSVEGLNKVDMWIYSFHMPLFFFLTGLFAIRNNNKKIKSFFYDKARTILYPYVIWSFIIVGLRIISGQLKDTNLLEFTLDFWKVIYQPLDIYWFLYVLFLVSAIYFLLKNIKINNAYILIGSCFLYLIHSIYSKSIAWIPLDQFMTYLIYFVSGALVSERFLYKNDKSNENNIDTYSYFLIGISVAAGILISVFIKLGIIDSAVPMPWFALVGIIGCVSLAKFLSYFNHVGFIENWGKLSLQIYVIHVAPAALTRIALNKFHIDNLLIHILLGVFAGIYGSIALWWIADKIKFRYLFTWPKNNQVF